MSEEVPVPPYPRATIRLQLNADFTFRDAERLVPYFSELGVSHIYASPFLLARPGSPHGYDIIDHTRINPEIGSAADLDALVERLHAHGMGMIMDFVPNHMGIGAADNAWWLDVLEWGRSSPFARFFDIDWKPYEQSLNRKVLLPVLGDHYGTVLESGDLVLRFDQENGEFSVWYHEHRFPIAVRYYAELLKRAARILGERRGSAAPGSPAGGSAPEAGSPPQQQSATEERRQAAAGAGLSTDPPPPGDRVGGRAAPQDRFREIAGGLARLGRGTLQPSKQAIEHRHAADLKRSLAELVGHDARARQAVEETVSEYNGTPGEAASFDALHRLLEKQSYRVSYWRVASNEINYRRFFDINELAGLRMEDQELFDITHELVFRLLDEGKIQGLRLDHVDGLYDPQQYFERLQNRAAYLVFREEARRDSTYPKARLHQPMYVAVEKILAHHEQLRGDWQVSGTTGYEFMNLVGELLTDPAGEEPLTALYDEVTDQRDSYEQMVVQAKYRVMHDTLASELLVLANRFNKLAKQSRRTRDFSRIGLRTALSDVVAHFPVYRAYVSGAGVSEEDRRDIDWAVARAKKYTNQPDTSIYDFIHQVLTLDLVEMTRRRRVYRKRDIVDLAMRVQQFTGPVMAKSLEDTSFYRYSRFIARNEVGGDPTRIYTSVPSFHKENKYRLERQPFNMLASATHDHKRGEDVRARLNVLSEVPERFAGVVRRLRDLSGFFKTTVDGKHYPSNSDEYFFYQTVLGSWPPDLSPPDWTGIEEFTKRLSSYMLKAIREAKTHTSWTAVNEEYETAMSRFIAGVLNPGRSQVVLRELYGFVSEIERPGAVNALAQLVLKLTSPGVPDIYQGCDRWDFSLVDPDNRRSVDFERRAEAMADLKNPDLEELTREWRDGRIKQYVTSQILALRRRAPDLFAVGSYEPLSVTPPAAEHVVAFLRRHEERAMVVCVPRLSASKLGAEQSLSLSGYEESSVRLPEELGRTGTFRELLSGTEYTPHPAEDGLVELPVGPLLCLLPVAVLESGAR